MGLKEQLRLDLRDAMRARDVRRKAALRMVLTNIQLAEVEKESLTDTDVEDLIRREVRRREDALDIMKQAGRDDLLADEISEIEVLRVYLPQLLSEEEITVIAREAISEAGAASPSDVGNVMKILMPRVKGKADGRMVNKVVRGLLAV